MSKIIAWLWDETPPLVLLYVTLTHGMYIESAALVLYLVISIYIEKHRK